MTGISKILRFEWLLCMVVLVATGSSFAQIRRVRRPPVQPTTSTNPSTADQEGQPNTLQYPQRPSNAGYTNAQDPPPVPAAPVNNQPAAPTQPVRPATPAQTNPPTAAPQYRGFIGPLVPVPPTPETMPPAPPKIAYQDGLLSVDSVNSRLTDILNGIHTRTGIQFEGLQPGQDRVAGKFGPAPADEVLTSLLRGSRYDYVILGVPENPALVQRVILTPSSTAAGTVAGVASGSTGHGTQASEEDDDNASEDTEGQPEQVQAPEQSLPRPRANANPKTTEQLVEELKQMQQQNQQKQPSAPVKPTIPQ